MSIKIDIDFISALEKKTDVLVIKHAQNLYGVDFQVTYKLLKFHSNLRNLLPKNGEFLQISTFGCLGANEILFVGVPKLYDFRYQNIREFSRNSIEYLAKFSPNIRNICFTLHGVGYGLDEMESFEAEIAGFVDAISEFNFPTNLEKITIVENKIDRAERLKDYLSDLLPYNEIRLNEKGALQSISNISSNRLREVGYTSESKPFVFVAMPFQSEMYDVFHYGIKGAINNAGYLCERIDELHFTGDIMEQVKKRIRECTLVVADLTKANPNVYLEVGYALGVGKSIIFLIGDADDLKFDVQGQKCLIYSGIKELEELLRKELENIEINE